MATTVQKGLRSTIFVLFFSSLTLNFTLLLRRAYDIEWDWWFSVVTEILLSATYAYSRRGTCQVNKWVRAIPILLVAVALLMFSSLGMKVDRFPCNDGDNDCILYFSWKSLVILASFLTIVEVVYTLFKGPMNPHRPEFKPQDTITDSTPQYPYGIQPNVAVPCGEAQPQHIQQPLYQQSMYPSYHNNPYPVMHDPGTAMPLQNVVQQHSSFKYEAPAQPQYPQLPPLQQQQQQHQQQPYPIMQQPPHPYSAGAYTHSGPMVTSVPQPGPAPAFTGRVSGISLASPVMPVAISSSPAPTSPTTPHTRTS
ncbi:hypothetical protein BGW42_005822, partial [Actinomortierella wolfii]